MSDIRFENDGQVVVDGVDALIVAGWTGRDHAGVQHHIRELEALGVAPPSKVPLFYRTSAALLGRQPMIEVVGERSSGEAEPMLVHSEGRLWLGVASDHTDRALEAHSVALSKQVCAKPCAAGLWPLGELDEVLGERLDACELRSWISDDPDGDDWTLYQEGTLGAIRPLDELLRASPVAALSRAETNDPAGARTVAMLCGTLPAIGGVRPAAAFRFQLHDPSAGRTLEHAYRVLALPAIG